MEEKKMYPTNFDVAVHWLGNHYILCNNLPDIDHDCADEAFERLCNDENECCTEIFQWYLSDCSDHDADWMNEHFGLCLVYSYVLDLYVMPVTHFGTRWSYVDWETDNEYAKRDLGETK